MSSSYPNTFTEISFFFSNLGTSDSGVGNLILDQSKLNSCCLYCDTRFGCLARDNGNMCASIEYLKQK